jgi:tRNA nucleotidyltransferase (CCA-adding enzyme)
MKAIGVYGAEIEKEGFSGYASEVLVYSHQSFEGVLSFFSNLKLDEEKHFTLTDPVDPGRELATAISKETIAKMILASRSFLANPDPSYFKKVKRKTRRILGGMLYCIRFDHTPLSEDTLWGELKKSTRQIVKYVEDQGFVIVRSGPISNGSDKSAIVLLPELDELPRMFERTGPSVDLAKETSRFISKNKEKSELVWVGEDGKLHILQKRRYRRLGRLLEEVCNHEIQKIGASRDVSVSIQKTGSVLDGLRIAKERSKEQWFREGIDSIVTDTIGTDSG